MANTNLVNAQSITRKATAFLKNNCKLIANATHEYESKFAQGGLDGGKLGDTVYVRKAIQSAEVRTDMTMDVKDTIQTSVPVKIDKIFGTDFSFTDLELQLDIDDFEERVMKPKMAVLAQKAESAFARHIMENTPGAVVGTLGTPVNSATNAMQVVRMLRENLAPAGSPFNFYISPNTEATIVPALSTLFNPSALTAEQNEKGMMSRAFGLDWYGSTLNPSLSTGTRTDTTPTVVSFSAANSTITLQNTSSGGTYAAGETFELEGCYAVNPVTHESIGRKMQFVILEANTADTTNVTLKCYPPVYTSGQLQNVSTTPVGKAVKHLRLGAASGSYMVDLAVMKEAFAFVSIPLPTHPGVDSKSVTIDGITLNYAADFDITTRRYVSRIDLVCAFAPIIPELAVKYIY